MKKFIINSALAILSVSAVHADTIPVMNFIHHGPFPLTKQLTIGADTTALIYKQDWTTVLSKNPVPSQNAGQSHDDGSLRVGDSEPRLHSLSFNLQADRFAKAQLSVKGIDKYQITLNGRESGANLSLAPATYAVNISFITESNREDTVTVALITDSPEYLSLRNDGKRNFTLDDVLYGPQIGSLSLSPDGKWLLTGYSFQTPQPDYRNWQTLTNIVTGEVTVLNGTRNNWMPRSNRYYFEQKGLHGKEIITVDPATGKREIFASNIPDGRYFISPDESSLFYYINKPGPRENSDIYQILEPEDRQPGWRNRNHIARYDIASGVYSPLTDGHLSANIMDVSDDGSKLLISVPRTRLEKRPTTVFDILMLDLASMTVDTIVNNDGFVARAIFSPDANRILISGSPEALGGIGKNVPEGRIPSMVDTQLFIFDVNSKEFKPLTRDFDPNVVSFEWNRADGMIYLTAENKDLISFYRLEPRSGKITTLPVPEDNISTFSLPISSTAIAVKGQSASNPDRLYIFDAKSQKVRLLDEPKNEMLSDVLLGECHPWTFVSSRGDSINGRFYLPPNFDPSKKYPMIVNYYGGCSPTTRSFESRYPHNAYAALGYVVYVINPSGATGFGQEFSSRHVNTAGQGVAEDIIEGTKRFCEEHPFVNPDKIGCIGASYGGFMTQYLQTVTPIFAAAISHAGISDHTSYWGNGYWGYSYSEVSMADSYPWSDTDLYVKQSPLYNADKIHTPILFLHGDSDHNVPFAESIQLFTALKLLGRETALVAVSNQDHHILDIDKRKKWQNTIWAWFAKYLQDDPAWWDELYPPKKL